MSQRVSIKSLVRSAKSEDATERKTLTKDSFQNFSLKLGMGTDNALSASTYGFNPITRNRIMLEWIHRGSWVGGAAVDIPADDMTRAGVRIKGELEPEQIATIEETATKLRIWPEIRDNVAWSRMYGGALNVYLIDGQKLSTPLRVETVGLKQFKGILTLDRWMVDPSLNDLVPTYGPDLGLPKYYAVTANAPALQGERIHYSRVLRMDGVRLPFNQRMTENLWGISYYERMYDRMVAFDSATTGMAQSAYKSYLRTVRMKDLRENIAAGGGQLDGVVQYIQMMARFQSIEGVSLLDLEDEFQEGGAQNMAGLSDITMSIAQQVFGGIGMPLVRALSMSPAGFSTGDTDLRMWYDTINKDQNGKLKVPVTDIYRMIAQSEGFRVPKGFGIQFAPLWQLTETEKSGIASQVFSFISTAREQGVLKPELALKELKQASEITGYGTNITAADIKDAEEAGPPEPDDVEAAEVKGGTKPGGPKSPGGGGKPGKPDSGSKDSASTVAELARLHNLQVVIENPAGSIRRGLGWESVMPDDYGYLRRCAGADGQALDVFVGKDVRALNAYVIDTADLRTGLFDEHKAMLGYKTAGAAIETFLLAYDDGDGNPERIMDVTPLSMAEFKAWLAHGDPTQPCAGPHQTLDGGVTQDKKDAEGHEHAPAGNKKGGQFVSNGGGAGSAEPKADGARESYAEHTSKLDALKIKMDALKEEIERAAESGPVQPKLREALKAVSSERSELAKTPPISRAQSAKNLDSLIDLNDEVQTRIDALEEVGTKKALAEAEELEQAPGAEIGYTSDAAMKKVQSNDKLRGFDWDKGQHRLVVRAPEDRSQWPLHCLGFMEDGTKVQGIPPDATDIYLGLNEDSAFWGSYMPSNGGDRKPVYHPNYKGQSKAIGDDRVRGMSKDLAGIHAAVEKACKTAKGVDAEHAFVQALNLHTLIRTGNEDQKTANKVQRDKSAEDYGKILEEGKKTYGLTTLQARHVVERKDGLHLKFDGKMGEDVDILVSDTWLADSLRERADKILKTGKSTDQLFPSIDDNSLRAWREGISIGNGRTLDFYKIHDIRSRVATDEAIKLVDKMRMPLSAAQWKESFHKVLAHVGPMLGHKPKGMVTATSYIIPDVWSKWGSKFADQKIMSRIRKAHGGRDSE